jgi:hypothetical protein
MVPDRTWDQGRHFRSSHLQSCVAMHRGSREPRTRVLDQAGRSIPAHGVGDRTTQPDAADMLTLRRLALVARDSTRDQQHHAHQRYAASRRSVRRTSGSGMPMMK